MEGKKSTVKQTSAMQSIGLFRRESKVRKKKYKHGKQKGIHLKHEVVLPNASYTHEYEATPIIYSI